jgi:hypothetical protein
MECGETLLAVRAANHFSTYGIRFGLLETSGPDDNPLIYTHNVNIGSLTFVLLEALGIQSLAAKTLLPLAAYGFGLLYLYLIVRQVTRSELVALVTLLLFATTYWAVGAFALNALRAWHTLGFFSVVLHTYNLINSKRRLDPRHVVGLGLGACITFGCGYDFWVICAAVAVALLFIQDKFPFRVGFRVAVVVGCIFFVPFVLRQIHVAFVMGLAFWWQDLTYMLAIKIPYGSKVITLPSMQELEAWYVSQRVMLPPASPTSSIAAVYYTFRHMLAAVTLPRWGWLNLLTLVAVVLIPIIPRLRGSTPGMMSATLLLPILIGLAIGILFLAPFSLHVYFKHEFPLVAFPLLLAKGAIVGWCAEAVWYRRSHAAVAGIVVAVYIFDSAMVHWNNRVNGPSNNFGWVKFVLDHPDAEFVLATYDTSLSRKLPMLDNAKVTYIRPQDAIGQISKPSSSAQRYLVYQPIERFSDFDAPVPRCTWRNWIAAVFKNPPPRSAEMSCIYGTPLDPKAVAQPSLDDIARLGGVIERSDAGVGYVIVALPGA